MSPLRMKINTPVSQETARLVDRGRKAGLDMSVTPDRIYWRGTMLNGHKGGGSFPNDIDHKTAVHIQGVWWQKYGILIVILTILGIALLLL